MERTNDLPPYLIALWDCFSIAPDDDDRLVLLDLIEKAGNARARRG